MTILVEGMMCGHCKKAVTDALMKADNISNVEINLDNGEVKIEGDNLDKKVISEIISSAGYKVV